MAYIADRAGLTVAATETGSGSKARIVRGTAVIHGRKTSVSLEREYWEALKMTAHTKRMTVSDLVPLIDDRRTNANLSSAVRVYVVAEARAGRLGPISAEPQRR